MALPDLPLVAVAALLVTLQLVQTPYVAAQTASLPVILDTPVYPTGQAIFDSSFNIGQLLGLATAGVLVFVLGAHLVLGIDAATCVVSALVIHVCIRRRPAAARRPTASERRTKLLHIVRGEPEVVPLIAMVWVVSFAMVPEGLSVPLAAEVGRPWAVGLFLAVDAGANLLGLAVLGRWVSHETRLRSVGLLCTLTVAPLLLFLLPLDLIGMLTVLTLTGMAGAYHTTAKAALNLLIADDWRGRVFGVIRVGVRAGQGLGIAAGGLVASMTHSPREAVALAGGAGVLACIAPVLMSRRMNTACQRRMPRSAAWRGSWARPGTRCGPRSSR